MEYLERPEVSVLLKSQSLNINPVWAGHPLETDERLPAKNMAFTLKQSNKVELN
jgi:hypothetical protein